MVVMRVPVTEGGRRNEENEENDFTCTKGVFSNSYITTEIYWELTLISRRKRRGKEGEVLGSYKCSTKGV